MTADIRDEDLHAFIDGELDEARHPEVLAHLEANPETLARVAEYLEQKQLVREGLERLAVRHDPETERLGRRLEAQLGRPAPASRLRRTAAVALMFGAGWVGNSAYREAIAEPVPDLVEDAAQVHQIFAEDRVRPVEIPGRERAEMVRWFSEHLGEPVEIPALGPVGLQLVGGRLLGTEEGPVAQLLYEDASGRRLTLCLSAQEVESGPEIHLVEVDGLTAGYWQEDEIAYALVAETPSEQLLEIAAELGGMPPDSEI
ncbi:MAG TPA: anti-sigma factor [Alphaproteobacteria bacterium]|nr:anti-sigma factor [Alphaproteobacteria bacterium]